MTITIHSDTKIHAPIKAVFDISLDIDAHLASMASSNERVVGGVSSGLIGLGEEVTWRISHFGLPFTMTTRITSLTRPDSFVDEQVKGPFRFFRHDHHFEEVEGGTLMTDHLELEAPFGPLGVLVERAILGRHMKSFLTERNSYLQSTLKSGSAA